MFANFCSFNYLLRRSSQSVDPGTPQPMLDVVNSSLMDGPESFLDASSLGMVSRGDGASGSGDLLLGGGQDPHGGAGSSQEGGSSANEGDWNFDPSEPRYCVCNQVSYGEMVACDNEDVRNFLKRYFLWKIHSRVFFLLLIFSVRMSGSITLVLASLQLQKGNGIARRVWRGGRESSSSRRVYENN